MSRCASCNCELSSREESRFGKWSNERLYLCWSCMKGLEIEYAENPNLPDNDGGIITEYYDLNTNDGVRLEEDEW